MGFTNLLFVALASVVAGTALADTPALDADGVGEGRRRFAIEVGYASYQNETGDANSVVRFGFDFRGWAGYEFRPHARWGVTPRVALSGTYHHVWDESTESNASNRTLSLGAVVAYRGETFRPYIQAGVGPAWLPGAGSNAEAHLGLEMGAGIHARLTEAVALGFSATWRSIWADGYWEEIRPGEAPARFLILGFGPLFMF